MWILRSDLCVRLVAQGSAGVRMVTGESARCHVTVANEKLNWVKERYEQIKILVNKNKLCFDWGIPRVGERERTYSNDNTELYRSSFYRGKLAKLGCYMVQ